MLILRNTCSSDVLLTILCEINFETKLSLNISKVLVSRDLRKSVYAMYKKGV